MFGSASSAAWELLRLPVVVTAGARSPVFSCLSYSQGAISTSAYARPDPRRETHDALRILYLPFTPSYYLRSSLSSLSRRSFSSRRSRSPWA